MRNYLTVPEVARMLALDTLLGLEPTFWHVRYAFDRLCREAGVPIPRVGSTRAIPAAILPALRERLDRAAQPGGRGRPRQKWRTRARLRLD
jgi:hypothetical protein